LIGQDILFGKSTDSTILFKEFSSEKVVAYTIDYVTVFMSCDDYKNDIEVVWNIVMKGFHQVKNKK
jgi:hypothetical protein